ncbi:hypothetical protein Daus18300_013125 [Diaporthe australafricana]|uniref:Alcohol dehydrogenase-like N-terminal domain-containing protein n=1 Tax=Diaporthe australafricana TaxID=127596 RepID=A0ABR3W053_9PEZI
MLDAQDAIVRVTTAAICGSDLHIYHGILGSTEVLWAMGHEAMGIVVETGSAVTSVKEGDHVVISAGQTRAQEPGQLQLEPSIGGGFDMFGGGKDFAEYVRVPLADGTLMRIGNPQIPDREFLFLSDIFATGWQALDFAGFQPGDDVAARLAKARSIGAVLRLAPDGVTRVCDCVGYECVDERLKPDRGFVLNEAVKMASDGGGIGVAGVYLAQPNSKGTPRAGTIAPDLTFPMTLF